MPMGAIFSADQFKYAKYHERLYYTYGPVTLATGRTTIFDVQFGQSGSPTREAILDSIAVTQNASVQLQWTYDDRHSDSSQGWTDAFPAGLRPVEGLNIRAFNHLSLAVNNTGSPVANFILVYTVTVRDLTIADKLLEGMPLSPEDSSLVNSLPPSNGQTGLQQLQALIQGGTMPIAFRRAYDATILNRRLPDMTLLTPVHVTVGSNTAAATLSYRPEQGAFLMLEELALEGAPNMTVSIDRDGVLDYMNVNGQAYTQSSDNPWRPILFVTQSIVFHFSGAAGTYPARIGLRQYRLSDLMAIRLGMTQTPDSLLAKVRVGLK